MAAVPQEDTRYKHDDYAVRSNDAYAMAKYQVILNWLPKTEGLRVLNAGCGSGEMTALLARQRSWQVDAIDVDPEAIQLSQTIKQELRLTNVNIYETGIEAHTGRDYDIIICNDVLEHLADDNANAKALAAMLKPGGMLCVSVPALQSLFGYHDELLGHYRRYDRRMLTTLLSPYVVVKHCRYFAFTLIPIALLYSKILRKNYPVQQSTGVSLGARILNACFNLEKAIIFPLGTSLLACAVAPSQK